MKKNRTIDMPSLRKLFNDADLQGIYFGDNADEYDPEINAIVKVLPNCDSAHKVKGELWSIFRDKFGADIAGPENAYEGLSQALFDWKKKHGT